MGLYNTSKVEDERITNIKNKIYAEIYILVSVICIISFVVKYLIYGVGIGVVATELIILMLSGSYYLYRSTKLGIYSAEVEMHDSRSKWPQKKKNLYSGLALGIGIALFFGINSAVQYAEGVSQSISYFFVTAGVSLMIYVPFFLIILVVGHDVIKKSSDQAINKILDDDESGEDDEKY
jgi:hypothetical protein